MLPNAVLDPSTGATLNYHHGPDRNHWQQGPSNEIGHLAQGVLPHMPSGTDTIYFIPITSLPAGCKPTYLHVVAEYKPHTEENSTFISPVVVTALTILVK
jgi:hypothetical protein